MASSHPASNSKNGKNLRCGVCNNVFRCPKLLPCTHTFCLACLEDLSSQGSQKNLTCPQCEETVRIPTEGVEYFKDNPYITKEELALERNSKKRAMCLTHPEDPLKYFCLECQQALCISCKLTEHMPHKTEDLSKAAGERTIKLKRTLERTEETMRRLTRASDLVQNNLQNSRRKADVLREQVHAEYKTLVSRAGQLRDRVLEGLDDVAENIEQELTADANKLQKTLETLTQFQERVINVLDHRGDAEVVAVEKEAREGAGNPGELAKIDALSRTPYTLRPGLHSYARSLTESLERDVLLYLGSPVRLRLPNMQSSRETVSTFYRCGTEEANIREVRDIHCTDDRQVQIAYGGKAPSYTDEIWVHLDRSGIKTHKSCQGGTVCVDQTHIMSTHASPSRLWSSSSSLDDAWDDLQASSNSYFRLRTYLYDSRKPTIKGGGRVNERAVSFEINAVSKPPDFDANVTGELFVVIDEDEMKDRVAETEHRYHNSTRMTREATLGNGEGSPSATANARQVRLYRKNLSDPVAIYTSPDQPFLPSAVSFFKQGRQELVLIADWLNDSVHVTRIENGEFRFVRYLDASRSGELVRPSAFSANKYGDVWIGCKTGCVLRCRSFSIECWDEAEHEELSHLEVAIESRSSTMNTNDD